MGIPEIPEIPENFNSKFDKIVIGGFILLSTINIFLFINYVQKLDYYIKYATYMQHECDNQLTLEKYTMRSIMFNNKDRFHPTPKNINITSIENNNNNNNNSNINNINTNNNFSIYME